MTHRMIGFADGENLVFRYQAMVAEGAIPKPNVVHHSDLLVWHPEISESYLCDIVRISYYQTVVGDAVKIDEARDLIAAVKYEYKMVAADDGTESRGTLRPRVFKKESKATKTKSVDINLTVDMLRHAADSRIDALFLLSGDGDYLPLIEEVARMGKQVWLAAFSKGLNKQLRYAADEFLNLDDLFFAPAQV